MRRRNPRPQRSPVWICGVTFCRTLGDTLPSPSPPSRHSCYQISEAREELEKMTSTRRFGLLLLASRFRKWGTLAQVRDSGGQPQSLSAFGPCVDVLPLSVFVFASCSCAAFAAGVRLRVNFPVRAAYSSSVRAGKDLKPGAFFSLAASCQRPNRLWRPPLLLRVAA